jgi:uncharacterized membrane protein YozB (DUF420 family)
MLQTIPAFIATTLSTAGLPAWAAVIIVLLLVALLVAWMEIKQLQAENEWRSLGPETPEGREYYRKHLRKRD